MNELFLLKKRFFVGFAAMAVVLFFGTGLAAFGQTIPGDADGDGLVIIVDALTVARHVAGLPTPAFNAVNADADANGEVNIIDALAIARYAAGIYAILPPHAIPGPSPTLPAQPSHLDNAFAGAKWYVNPEWSSQALAAGGAAVANCNTAVWLKTIADINPADGRTGLRKHLDNCLQQGANLIIIVLNNLPDRDCTATPTGELQCDASGNGLTRYKTEFINPIVAILKDPQYYSLRIVTIIEPDALPNLVTNVDRYQKCSDIYTNGCHLGGIQYILNNLAPLPNVYEYLDIANSAWLGWPDNFNKAISLYTNVVKNTIAGVNSIDGFITNTGYTIPLDEPFIPDGDTSIGGVQIKQSRFYDWNAMVDELQYANAWYARMADVFPGIGMLTDTSRNGWGGPDRPTRASTSTDVNTYVDQSRIDRRFHRGNWCNNKYAGIGERPTAAPCVHYDAFVWMKMPGESDGPSSSGIIDPLDPNKKYDNMCDPNGKNTYCDCGTTDARADMPYAGRWSGEFFRQLLANAYPPVN